MMEYCCVYIDLINPTQYSREDQHGDMAHDWDTSSRLLVLWAVEEKKKEGSADQDVVKKGNIRRKAKKIWR